MELAPNNLKQAIKLVKALKEQRRAQKSSDDRINFKILAGSDTLPAARLGPR
jgi:hypothetical protein